MVSAALLDREYVMVEESVVDDLSDRSHDYSVEESFIPTVGRDRSSKQSDEI